MMLTIYLHLSKLSIDRNVCCVKKRISTHWCENHVHAVSDAHCTWIWIYHLLSLRAFLIYKDLFYFSGRCSGLRFALVKICFSFNLINIFGCLFSYQFFFLLSLFLDLTQLFSFCLNVLSIRKSIRLYAIQMELSHLFRHNFPFEEVP